MKKILLGLLLALLAPFSFGQSYPSPTYKNLTVNGSFTATGLVTTSDLAAQAANTVLANATGSIASPTAFAMPSCSGGANALSWTSGAGFSCNTSLITAASVAATYAPLASPALTGTPTAPTAAVGTNTTQIATTAFIANHAPCPSIMDNGGNNGGSVDNSAAFAATAALGPSGAACVYFPPGTYAFSSQLVYSLAANSSITIEGAGIAVTKLVWSAGGGMQINYGNSVSNAHIRDLSVIDGTIGGTGLSLSSSGSSGNAQAQLSTIDNVAVYGSGFIATNYWATGIQIDNVSNVNLKGVVVVGANATYQSNGVGLSILGASASSEAVQINIVASNFSYIGTGILYGSYVQGVTVVSSNFTGNDLGIHIPTPLASQSGLSVTMSQFNCLQWGIFDQVGVAGFFVDGNYFEFPYNGGSSVIGVEVDKVYGHIISNNFFERIGATATGLIGVAIVGSSTVAGNISGNVLFALDTGIWLQAASTSMVVQDNTYSSNGTNLLDQGTGNFAAFQQGNPGYEFSANGNLHEWGQGVVTTDTSGNFSIALPKVCPTAFDRAIVDNGDSTNNPTNPLSVSTASTSATLSGRMANITSATAIRVTWDVMCH